MKLKDYNLDILQTLSSGELYDIYYSTYHITPNALASKQLRRILELSLRVYNYDYSPFSYEELSLMFPMDLTRLAIILAEEQPSNPSIPSLIELILKLQPTTKVETNTVITVFKSNNSDIKVIKSCYPSEDIEFLAPMLPNSHEFLRIFPTYNKLSNLIRRLVASSYILSPTKYYDYTVDMEPIQGDRTVLLEETINLHAINTDVTLLSMLS